MGKLRCRDLLCCHLEEVKREGCEKMMFFKQKMRWGALSISPIYRTILFKRFLISATLLTNENALKSVTLFMMVPRIRYEVV